MDQLFNIEGVEIFATGTHNGDAYSERDIDQLIEASSRLDYVPPLKAGHVEDRKGMPALGWVKNLRKAGNKLVADFMDMPKAVYDAIKGKRYNTVSSEIYWNLKRGGNEYPRALKAVALLGAEIPAVAGLKPLHEMFDLAEDNVHFAVYVSKQYARDPGDAGEGKGVWRTIRGRHVFIRDGESLQSAMKRSLDYGKGKGDNTDTEGGGKKPKTEEEQRHSDREASEKEVDDEATRETGKPVFSKDAKKAHAERVREVKDLIEKIQNRPESQDMTEEEIVRKVAGITSLKPEGIHDILRQMNGGNKDKADTKPDSLHTKGKGNHFNTFDPGDIAVAISNIRDDNPDMSVAAIVKRVADSEGVDPKLVHAHIKKHGGLKNFAVDEESQEFKDALAKCKKEHPEMSDAECRAMVRKEMAGENESGERDTAEFLDNDDDAVIFWNGRLYHTYEMNLHGIDWGQHGAFNECVTRVGSQMSDPKAFCAYLHERVTGKWPGERQHELGGELSFNHEKESEMTPAEVKALNDKLAAQEAELEAEKKARTELQKKYDESINEVKASIDAAVKEAVSGVEKRFETLVKENGAEDLDRILTNINDQETQERVRELSQAAAMARRAEEDAKKRAAEALADKEEREARIAKLEEDARLQRIDKIAASCRIPSMRTFINQYLDLATRAPDLKVFSQVGEKVSATKAAEDFVKYVNENSLKLFSVQSINVDNPMTKADDPQTEVDRRTKKYMHDHNVKSYPEAMRQVLEADPALKHQYAIASREQHAG